MAGHRVRYVLATELVDELVEAADEKMLAKPSPAMSERRVADR